MPGCWPGITDYMQKDCQTLYSHPSWRGLRPAGLYLDTPEEWDDPYRFFRW